MPNFGHSGAESPRLFEGPSQVNADLNITTNPNNPILPKGTPLHVAAYYGCVEAAIALLELGADPNPRDANGRTPLHLAVSQSNILLIRLLKAHQASLCIRDAAGRTPAQYAVTPEISQELNDPIIPPLFRMIRSGVLSDSVERIIRRHSGIPGILSGQECLDVDGGDGWTPLMEAVSVG